MSTATAAKAKSGGGRHGRNKQGNGRGVQSDNERMRRLAQRLESVGMNGGAASIERVALELRLLRRTGDEMADALETAIIGGGQWAAVRKWRAARRCSSDGGFTAETRR